MASVHGIDLATLKADMEAQARGYFSAEAERMAQEIANSGKLARKAAQRARRDRLNIGKPETVSAGNWTAEQYRRNNPNSAIVHAMSELGIS